MTGLNPDSGMRSGLPAASVDQAVAHATDMIQAAHLVEELGLTVLWLADQLNQRDIQLAAALAREQETRRA